MILFESDRPRPSSLVAIEWIFAAKLATVLGIVACWVVRSPGWVTSAPVASSPPQIIANYIAVLAIDLALLFYTTRRANNVAKWLSVGVVAISVFTIVREQMRFVPLDNAAYILKIFFVFLRLVSAAMLFRADSRQWFRGEWSGEDLRKTFS